MNSALFSVSINEIVLVAVVAVVAYVLARRTERHWLLGIPAMLAALSAVTPADPVSTLLTGIPVSVIYVVAFLRTERRLRSGGTV
jgi:Sec-independent protein secretion pathway component TatC